MTKGEQDLSCAFGGLHGIMKKGAAALIKARRLRLA